MRSFDLKRFLASIVEYRTDAVAASRALFWLALDQPQFRDLDVSHVRLAACGDTPMGPVQLTAMTAAFPNARVTCTHPAPPDGTADLPSC
jgi:long-chain acyl-CoA synthetase